MAFLLACILIGLVSSSSATCRCETKHIQDYFCAADFVANVTIGTKSPSPSQGKFSSLLYKVTLNEVYKGNPKSVQGLKKGELETGDSADSCGVTWLKPGTSIIVSGFFDPKTSRPQFSTCGMLLLDLTANQRAMISGGYQIGCDRCKIEPCTIDCSGTGLSQHTCPWNTNWSFEDCQVRYSACLPTDVKSSTCQWKSSPQYRSCLSPDRI